MSGALSHWNQWLLATSALSLVHLGAIALKQFESEESKDEKHGYWVITLDTGSRGLSLCLVLDFRHPAPFVANPFHGACAVWESAVVNGPFLRLHRLLHF